MPLKNRYNSNRVITTRRVRYKNIEEVGSGTFGKVFSAVYDGKKYAIKKYVYSNQPLHMTTIREIKALRALKHPNIVAIEEIVINDYHIWAVFPFYETDLNRMLRSKSLSGEECKDLFLQIIKGVQYMHKCMILHRDLKTANILIERQYCGKFDEYSRNSMDHGLENECDGIRKKIKADGVDEEVLPRYIVKICDFGMAKSISKEMTPGVVTLWYRAPEILLGCDRYGEGIDIWSLGCILFEMLTTKPLFRGNTEVEQLEEIVKYCGSINFTTMPMAESYQLFSKYNLPSGDRNLKESFPCIEPVAMSLLDEFLVLDPQKRISLNECLEHPYFHENNK